MASITDDVLFAAKPLPLNCTALLEVLLVYVSASHVFLTFFASFHRGLTTHVSERVQAE